MRLQMFITTIAFFTCAPAFAHFMDGYIENPRKELIFDGHTFNGQTFLSPNEFNPQDSGVALSETTEGLHASVGTERGLMGFALNPNATYYLGVDADSRIPIFKRIKIALFQMSTSREDLVHLTLNSDFSEWSRRANHVASPTLDPEFQAELTEENFKVFRQIHRQKHHLFMTESPGSMGQFRRGDAPFEGANYLYESAHYDRLKTAADEGRMYAIQLNLDDRDRVRELVQFLADKEISLSVMDISNAWQNNPGYMGVLTGDLIKDLRAIASEKSMLMVTVPPNELRGRFGGTQARFYKYVGMLWSFAETTFGHRDNYFNFDKKSRSYDTGVYGPGHPCSAYLTQVRK